MTPEERRRILAPTNGSRARSEEQRAQRYEETIDSLTADVTRLEGEQATLRATAEKAIAVREADRDIARADVTRLEAECDARCREEERLATIIDEMTAEQDRREVVTDQQTARAEQAERERDGYKAALEYYADRKNWQYMPRYGTSVTEWLGGGAGLDFARNALAAATPAEPSTPSDTQPTTEDQP